MYIENNSMLGYSNVFGYSNAYSSIDNINYSLLNKLGFSNDEINDVCLSIKNFGRVDRRCLMQCIQFSGTYSITNEIRMNKLMYLGRIIINRSERTNIFGAIETIQANPVCENNNLKVEQAMNIISLHYSKMFRDFSIGGDKFINRDLGTPKLRYLKSLAWVGGIEDPIFEIYNSNRYLVKDRFYIVLKNGATNTTLLTSRKPVLAMGQEPKVAGVGEIKDIVTKDGKTLTNLVINNKYVSILNRFVIAVSTRKPVTHCGMVELICQGGTRLYVYAVEWNNSDSVNGGVNYRNDGAGSNSAKIYDYGFNGNDLENKLIAVASYMYNHLGGIIKICIKPEHNFETKAVKVKTKAEKVAEQQLSLSKY